MTASPCSILVLISRRCWSVGGLLFFNQAILQHLQSVQATAVKPLKLDRYIQSGLASPKKSPDRTAWSSSLTGLAACEHWFDLGHEIAVLEHDRSTFPPIR